MVLLVVIDLPSNLTGKMSHSAGRNGRKHPASSSASQFPGILGHCGSSRDCCAQNSWTRSQPTADTRFSFGNRRRLCIAGSATEPGQWCFNFHHPVRLPMIFRLHQHQNLPNVLVPSMGRGCDHGRCCSFRVWAGSGHLGVFLIPL